MVLAAESNLLRPCSHCYKLVDDGLRHSADDSVVPGSETRGSSTGKYLGAMSPPQKHQRCRVASTKGTRIKVQKVRKCGEVWEVDHPPHLTVAVTVTLTDALVLRPY